MQARLWDQPLPDPCPYVSRGGLKLHAALHAFALDPTGWICADLGCSHGGFTDCLLQHGAAKVHAVDTAYGILDWKLRQDPRVMVHERSNALHLQAAAACDLVTLDLGWTRQEKAIPAALRWLGPGGRIISLIKPHYECGQHRLEASDALAIAEAVVQALPAHGVQVLDHLQSPITGGRGGNLETLALLTRAS